MSALNDTADGIVSAVSRQTFACIAGLFAGWTALFVALWLAFMFAIAGAIGGAFAIGFLTANIGQASQGLVVTGAASGFAAGFIAGFITILGDSIGAGVGHLVLSLVIGAVAASAITFLSVWVEPFVMDLRQFRRPSRRAEEGKLVPMLSDVADALGYSRMPYLRIHDSPIPGAWAHVQHIVISKGLLAQMDDDELAAIMAHELHHWDRGDAEASRFVWACALPVILMVNLYSYVTGRRIRNVVELGVMSEIQQVQQNLLQLAMAAGRFTAGLLLLLVWPAIVLMRLLIRSSPLEWCEFVGVLTTSVN